MPSSSRSPVRAQDGRRPRARSRRRASCRACTSVASSSSACRFAFPSCCSLVELKEISLPGDLGGSCHGRPDCYLYLEPLVLHRKLTCHVCTDRENADVTFDVQVVIYSLSRPGNESLNPNFPVMFLHEKRYSETVGLFSYASGP